MMISGQVVATAALTAGQREAMYALMAEQYENVTHADFVADLGGKRDVIVLAAPDGSLAGFSTQTVQPFAPGVQLVFSGDTVVGRAWWNRNDLAAIWMRYAFDCARGFAGETYWLLMSKGWRTYRYLPAAFREFHPRRDTPLPPGIAAIIDGFGQAYPARYDNGILYPDKDHVKPEYGEASEQALHNPDVAFFLARNPGHAAGDELVCITAIRDDNLTAVGRRLLAGTG